MLVLLQAEPQLQKQRTNEKDAVKSSNLDHNLVKDVLEYYDIALGDINFIDR